MDSRQKKQKNPTAALEVELSQLHQLHKSSAKVSAIEIRRRIHNIKDGKHLSDQSSDVTSDARPVEEKIQEVETDIAKLVRMQEASQKICAGLEQLSTELGLVNLASHAGKLAGDKVVDMEKLRAYFDGAMSLAKPAMFKDTTASAPATTTPVKEEPIIISGDEWANDDFDMVNGIIVRKDKSKKRKRSTKDQVKKDPKVVKEASTTHEPSSATSTSTPTANVIAAATAASATTISPEERANFRDDLDPNVGNASPPSSTLRPIHPTNRDNTESFANESDDEEGEWRDIEDDKTFVGDDYTSGRYANDYVKHQESDKENDSGEDIDFDLDYDERDWGGNHSEYEEDEDDTRPKPTKCTVCWRVIDEDEGCPEHYDGY
jgi:hypothetical protein